MVVGNNMLFSMFAGPSYRVCLNREAMDDLEAQQIPAMLARVD